MWKVRFVLVLLAMATTCIVAPIVIWKDWCDEGLFLAFIDVVLLFLLGDFLWAKFKEYS